MGVAPKRAMTSPAVAITHSRMEGLAFIRHSFLTSRRLWGLTVGVDENGADKGRNCLYMKLCDLILLSMILQLE